MTRAGRGAGEKERSEREQKKETQSEGFKPGLTPAPLHKSQTHCETVGQLPDRLQLCVFVCVCLRLRIAQNGTIKLSRLVHNITVEH